MTPDPTNDQHWHLTAEQARQEFEQQHAGVPVEQRTTTDIEVAQNLALTTAA